MEANFVVIYRHNIIIGFEISFRDIGVDVLAIDKDVIPGLGARRLGFCHALVPLLGAFEEGVHIHNNTAVIKQLVADELSDTKFCSGFVHDKRAPYYPNYLNQLIIR